MVGVLEHISMHLYVYIYICIYWWDAVRGARLGLEYLYLRRDIWASELTSQL